MKAINFFKKSLKYILVLCVAMLTAFQFIIVKSGETKAEVIEREVRAALLADFEQENGYNLIQSADDLITLSNLTKSSRMSGAAFKQTCDIDLKNVVFTPIASGDYNFAGTYDGGGFSILNINVQSSGYAGLFGETNGATIKNVIINGGTIQTQGTTFTSGGAIAGHIGGRTTVTNCSNFNVKITSKNCEDPILGGIVGNANGTNVVISNCYSNGAVTTSASGEPWCGGIVGNIISGKVVGCMAQGNVDAGNTSTTELSYAGGIAGRAINAQILNCYSKDQTIDANAKTTTTTTTNTATDTDADGYLSITKETTTTIKESNNYSGGICGIAQNSTIQNNFIYKTKVYGGWKTTDYSYRYYTNKFAGFRGYAIWVAGNYEYIYYEFDVSIPDVPTVLVQHFGKVIGYSVSGNTISNNYCEGGSITSTDSVLKEIGTIEQKFENASASFYDIVPKITAKKSDVIKKFTVLGIGAPADVDSSVSTNNFLVSNISDYFWREYDYSGTGLVKNYYFTKLARGASWYGYDGKSTITFHGNTSTSTNTAFDMMLKIVREPLDGSTRIWNSDEGANYSLNWSFIYGYGHGSVEDWTYTDNLINCEDFETTTGKGGTNYVESDWKNSTFDATLWNIDENVNGGYPYLKDFYWQHNIQEPTD